MLARLLALTLAACASPALPLPPWRADGRPVVWEHRHLDGHAGAEWRGTRPVLYLDDDLAELAPVTQWWVAAHEVCHLQDQARTETQADCCASTWMARAGWLSAVQLAEVVAEVADWPEDEAHPSGLARVLVVMECSL